TVGRDSNIRRRESMRDDRFEKNFRLAEVTRSIWPQRQEINFSKSPIQREETILIMIRELGVTITRHARRRPAANGPQNVRRVGIISGPIPTAHPTGKPPAMMACVRDVINARRGVPR